MDDIVLKDSWRDRLEDLFARTRDNRLVLMLVAGAVALSLLVWSRGPAARVAPPARAVALPTASPSTAETLIVHIAGRVRHPGLYEFPVGARIADAIETAGGALRSADLDALNLAEELADGIQVNVPARGQAPAALSSTASTPGATAVPLNSADAAALETIPGVGPVTASAILVHRDQVGGFESIEELLDVDGIGPATLEAIRPYVTL